MALHSDAFRCIQCLLLVLKDREDSFEDCVAAPGPGPMADASPLSVHIANSPDGSRTHGWVPRHAQTGEPRATMWIHGSSWIIMDPSFQSFLIRKGCLKLHNAPGAETTLEAALQEKWSTDTHGYTQ